MPLRDDGSCIHLQSDGKCERYDTRPEQCRLYTCTLFSIAGVTTGSPVINEALAQWEWDLSSPADREFAEVARIKEGAYDRAQPQLQVLAGHADSLGWENLVPKVRVRMLIARANVEGWRGNRVQEADDLKQAGHLAVAAGDEGLKARVHLGLTRHARALGFLGEARFHIERARSLTGRTKPAHS